MSTVSRLTFRAAFASGLAMIILTTACTPSLSEPATQAPSKAAPAAPGAAPTAAAATGPSGEIVVATATDPVSMDPRICIQQTGTALLYHAFEPLVFRDDKMQPVPVLAESWTRPNPNTWEFRLRKGVKFQNGEDFDATSAKYSIDSVLDLNNKFVNAQYSSLISTIDRVDIKDNYTIQVHTKQASNALLQNLAVIVMLPPKAAAAAGDKYSNTPYGTGPYKITEYVSSSRMVLEAFDGYWGPKPQLKKITIRILPENATRVAALESGEAQLIDNLPTDAIDRIKGNANLQVLSTPSARIMFLGLQADRPPFNDVRVRQAMNYAIDKESLVKDLLGGNAIVATGPMYPAVFGFNNKLNPYPYDPAKAKDLLTQAGYPNGLKVKFGYPSGRYLMDKQVGEAVIGQLAKVGITVEPETGEWGTFFNNRVNGKYDGWLYGMGTLSVTPDFTLQWFGRTRLTKYANPTVDQLLADADAEPDQAKSAEMYQKAEEIIWNEAVWAFLYYQPALYGASKKVEGFKPRADEWLIFNSTSLSK